ncbi:MAG: DNA mismatch repair protein MutS [Oligoflexia bacterium]|nr:DNA mismatch repair protein MutS [Oligoflexia bacterium]
MNLQAEIEPSVESLSAEAPLSALPPMLQQYLQYKREHPDCLILFQVGDFYELFFEDAVTAARALNLTLTSRDKNNPSPVPMAGVPVAAVENYLARLVAQGFSAALVSQLPGKSVRAGVERRLERIITPGVNLLALNHQKEAGFIAALFFDPENLEGSQAALAFCEVQTARIRIKEGLSALKAAAEISKLQPSELILPQSVEGQRVDRRHAMVRDLERMLNAGQLKFRPESYFSLKTRSDRDFSKLAGYAALSPAARKAVRLLVGYVDEVTVSSSVAFKSAELWEDQRVVQIDAATRRTLELLSNSRDGSTRGTLLQYMDRCDSPLGSRLLRSWIAAPSAILDEIMERQQAVLALRGAVDLRAELKPMLQKIIDIDRVAARLELGAVSPKELGALRDSLETFEGMRQMLCGILQGAASALLEKTADTLVAPERLQQILGQLSDNPPYLLSEGGVIASGVNAELDRFRVLKSDSRSWIAEIENKERAATGITSLKIKFNNVIGYFFEVTQANSSKVPPHFVRRQSTANTERFTTEELRTREKEVLSAESQEFELERELYGRLRSEAALFALELRELAQLVAQLDVLTALAVLAETEGLVPPAIDQSPALEIEQGYHPVLRAILGNAFIPNDVRMLDRPCLLITGPNMGGKSTYLRQAGLIVIMAQLGSCVPAARAQIGIVDRIFARMGASDDISEGESTFMVEMREASNIIANCSARSLLLIDEIGRGTATADGLAIAQAMLEWLVIKIQCRVFFATHFHELTALEKKYPALVNLCTGAIEQDGQVIFTHQIEKGAADKSYGLEVAKLAGLPSPLLRRAAALLANSQSSAADSRQLTIFGAAPFADSPSAAEPAETETQSRRLIEKIRKFDLNNSTPLSALNFLNELIDELDR